MKKLRLRKFISQGQTVNKQHSNYSDSHLSEFPLFHDNFEMDFHSEKHSTYLKIKKKKSQLLRVPLSSFKIIRIKWFRESPLSTFHLSLMKAQYWTLKELLLSLLIYMAVLSRENPCGADHNMPHL